MQLVWATTAAFLLICSGQVRGEEPSRRFWLSGTAGTNEPVAATLWLSSSNITLHFPEPVPGVPPTAGFVGALPDKNHVALIEEFPGLSPATITGTLKLNPVRFSGQLVSSDKPSPVLIELREAAAYKRIEQRSGLRAFSYGKRHTYSTSVPVFTYDTPFHRGLTKELSDQAEATAMKTRIPLRETIGQLRSGEQFPYDSEQHEWWEVGYVSADLISLRRLGSGGKLLECRTIIRDGEAAQTVHLSDLFANGTPWTSWLSNRLSGDVLASASKAVQSPVQTLPAGFTKHFTIVPQGIRFELTPICNQAAPAEAAFEVVRWDELRPFLRNNKK